MMLDLAEPGDFVVMVKDFGREEMDLPVSNTPTIRARSQYLCRYFPSVSL